MTNYTQQLSRLNAQQEQREASGTDYAPWDVREHVALANKLHELLVEAEGALAWIINRIPVPEPIGRDDAGHPEYVNDIDHACAWERHIIEPVLAKIHAAGIGVSEKKEG